jgi:hypothetical protein
MKRWLLGFLVLLAGCGPFDNTAPPTSTPVAGPPTSAAPTASRRVTNPATATIPQATATQVAEAPVPVQTVFPPITPTSESAFVVPGEPTEFFTRRPVPNAVFSKPDIPREVQAFFEMFYEARTLQPGGGIDREYARSLVDGVYADYTMPLLDNEIRDAQEGKLLEVRYSKIKVKLDKWEPQRDGTGTALVSVTRTRTAKRSDRTEAPQNVTYRFRVKRWPGGAEMVNWVATDFFNPAANRWISETATANTAQIGKEIQAFFERFYAARSLARGGTIDLDATTALVRFAYQAYTMPLLEREKKDADEGKITTIAYRDIKATLVNYDPVATNHGALATVRVTRTALVTRPGLVEPPQTATYQFRVHRHLDEQGRSYWVAVDFLQPSAKRWVSEISGLSVVVPPGPQG